MQEPVGEAAEVEAENLILKQQAEAAVSTPTVFPVSISPAFQNEIKSLKEENSKLTETILKKDRVIQELNAKVNAWTSSSITLKSIIGEQRPAKCKYGLGYSGTETNKPKGTIKVDRTIRFVKSSNSDSLLKARIYFLKSNRRS